MVDYNKEIADIQKDYLDAVYSGGVCDHQHILKALATVMVALKEVSESLKEVLKARGT